MKALLFKAWLHDFRQEVEVTGIRILTPREYEITFSNDLGDGVYDPKLPADAIIALSSLNKNHERFTTMEFTGLHDEDLNRVCVGHEVIIHEEDGDAHAVAEFDSVKFAYVFKATLDNRIIPMQLSMKVKITSNIFRERIY